jgi:23S rRNA pseudouridine1911/1915/1917 synthase
MQPKHRTPIQFLRDSPLQAEYFFEVPEGQFTDVRLDVYITGFVQNATRSKVQKAIKEGHVVVNGAFEKASYVVQPGDRIEISLPKPPPEEARPEEMDLNILHEDETLIVVNKPAGLVVHPAFGNWQGTLVNGLLHHTKSTLSKVEDETIRPGIVHRIDKDTSGLLVVAKTEEAHAALSKQFQEKSVERTYQAVVWGIPEEEGTVTGDIARSRSDRKIMTVVPEGEGKHAVTHYRRMEVFDQLSLMEIRLETGRTHQIRVHMSHIGHPLFGDRVYGGDRVCYGSNAGKRKQLFRNLFEVLPRQALHARTLGFVHPGSGEWMQFESELPEDLQQVIGKLRRTFPES